MTRKTYVPPLNYAPSSPSRPEFAPKYLLAPVLYAMGVLTQFQRCKSIPILMPHSAEEGLCPVKDLALRVAGFNPDDPASLPLRLFDPPDWGKWGPSMYHKCKDVVYEHCTTFPEDRKRKTIPTFFIMEDNTWALTEEGVTAAVGIYSSFAGAKDPNVTSIWLTGQFKNGLYGSLSAALSSEQRMNREKSAGEISDHIHTFIEASVRRDSLRSWLLRGDVPTAHQLVGWIVRKGISAFRSYGQDAHMRVSRGALTARERSDKAPLPMLPSTYQLVLQGSEDGMEQAEQVLVDNAAIEQEHHNVAFAEGLDRVREALVRNKPGAAPRFGRVFDSLVEGATIKDLSRMEHVSRNRAAAIVADARLAIREAAQVTRDAKKILSYIQDEPFSTSENIRDDLSVETDLKWLLGELVARGRISQRGPSYLLTPKGEALLAEWELLPKDKHGNPLFDGDFGGLVAL